jgi:signal transduction histidine kinase
VSVLSRLSLRQRVALGLSAMFAAGFAVGFFVLLFGHDLIFRLWGSYSYPTGGNLECLWHKDTRTCYSPFSTAVHTWALVVVGAVLLIAAVAWWLMAGRTLRPLSQTVETVRQLGPQNLRQRIRMTGSTDVLKELADALDDALDRLVAGYEGQRRFAANASHELRTPLAVQRLLTEVAMDDPHAGDDLHRLGTQLIRVNERNERLIEGLLVLAESDRGVPGKVPVRLDKLAGSVLDAHAEMAGKNDVSLHRSLAEREISGDPLLLDRLIGNLVTNAILYNQPGGWVEVEVTGDGYRGPALSVRNTGQNVPAESVPSLFEPFRRLTADRTNHSRGAGLGMSIARSITAAHDGTIRARPRSEGGLIVEIELPLRPKD